MAVTLALRMAVTNTDVDFAADVNPDGAVTHPGRYAIDLAVYDLKSRAGTTCVTVSTPPILG